MAKNFYVIADSFDEAEHKLIAYLRKMNYSVEEGRQVESIKKIAVDDLDSEFAFLLSEKEK